ncbi:alpha/beta-hydrolase [Polychaeton citri CBS 116435]|uniref:Alpha/beta-hydrolase n=1 Tax=Polychaeton citri CBS 116435 TaxID=1314669 RepID=A0A9P4QE30_9PEZI|nr:alpha/beta-hydrolase [Polychaeton citri CBS 116435]
MNGLVSIGTHSLYLRAAGPARSLGTPAVILVAGLGDTCASSSAVARHISAFARVYVYDRAGLGNSELPTDFSLESKSYTNIAKELRRLLDTASIKPPFLLVTHSMGGLPGREFLHLYPEDVAGMIFVDTITEDNYKMRPKELPLVMRNMFMDIDRSFLWKGQHKPNMTPDELQQALEDEGLIDNAMTQETQTRRETAATAELRNLIPSSDALAEKCQFEKTALGDRPVSVIKADLPGEWRKSFEAATVAGRGTTAAKKLVGDYLATADATHLMLQFKQLRLSRNSRMVEARHSWHNVYWYQPELVAREVRWCLEEFGKIMAT